MSDLRIVYFGTPRFAVPTLDRLLGAFDVVAVVTQPDRPFGRGQKTNPGPVKATAVSRDVPVLQPARLGEKEFLEALGQLRPDLGVVAAYGKILPDTVLSLPRLGFVNVHASILPRWRGASPIHRAVMAGDSVTGVSIMRVVRELDAGGVFAVVTRPIGPDETSEEVEADLARTGADLLVSVVSDLERGSACETPQSEQGVTYAPRLTRDEGAIDWTSPAAAIHNQVRGLQPWPHAFTSLGGVRVIVLQSALPGTVGVGPLQARPGEVVSAGHEIHVVAGDERTLSLRRLQLEGRRPVSAREFSSGLRLHPGARFGTWEP